MSTHPWSFTPICHAKSIFSSKTGTPRQANITPTSILILDLDECKDLNNPQYSLDQLTEFSHLWVIFIFHQNNGEARNRADQPVSSLVKSKVAPPRLNGQKVGLFATRTPHRPNIIGLSLCKIDKVEGSKIFLSGCDLIDGTPILDVKPFIEEYDSPKLLKSSDENENIRQPKWAEPEIFPDLKVEITSHAMQQLDKLTFGDSSIFKKQNENFKTKFLNSVIEILKSDPRSVYRKNCTSDRLFYMTIDGIHVTAWFDDEVEGEVRCEILRFMVKQ